MGGFCLALICGRGPMGGSPFSAGGLAMIDLNSREFDLETMYFLENRRHDGNTLLFFVNEPKHGDGGFPTECQVRRVVFTSDPTESADPTMEPMVGHHKRVPDDYRVFWVPSSETGEWLVKRGQYVKDGGVLVLESWAEYVTLYNPRNNMLRTV